MFKFLITYLFNKYCRNDSWNLYMLNMGHFLSELQSAHIRNILTRVSRDELIEAIKNHKGSSISIVDIIIKAFNKKQFYENTNS